MSTKQPAQESKASLLDAEARGGPTAIKGFDFQRRYTLILLLESLPDPGFDAVLVEGAEDVEARFDRQGQIERRAIQLKNHRITTVKAREIIDHLKKLNDDSPSTWTSFVIACTELDDTLKAIHNSLERYRPSGHFYEADDAILANTRAEVEGQIEKAKLPVEFVLERVTFEPDLGWCKKEGLVRARALTLLHGAYLELSHTTAEEIYLRLKDLVSESTTKSVKRQQVEEIIDTVRARASVSADYYPIKLRAPLREVFAPLLEDRTKVFGGREKALATIADFIQKPEGGYFVITAPPGFGKTALMASLVKGTPEAFAYHFFTPLYGDASLSELWFLKNVVEQMDVWHGHKGKLPDELPELQALYQQFIGEPLDKTQVLVIDGLDEVTRWKLTPYLSRHLPENLHMILTVRDVGQDWRAEYRLPVEQVIHLPLDGLDQAGIAAVLRAAGGAALAYVEDPTMLGEIRRVAAYPADSSLGADPFYVRVLAEDAAAGELSMQEITKRPPGLDKYLDEWWQQVRAMAGDQPARDLFGTLTVALGPISRDDLEAINPSLVDDWAEDRFDEVLRNVRRFVMGDHARGYALAHPRLREYMRARIKTRLYLDKLLAYCAHWREHKSHYALRHYAAHLADAGQPDALYSLISKDWMETKLAELASPQPFAEDVDLTIATAEAETPVNWPQLIRGCLLYSSLSSMVSETPIHALTVLIRTGESDRLRQAYEYAALFARDRYCEVYLRMGEVLTETGKTAEAKNALKRAMENVDEIVELRDKVDALHNLARALVEMRDLETATQATKQAQDAAQSYKDRWAPNVLCTAAQTLTYVGEMESATELVKQAWNAALMIDEEGFRVHRFSDTVEAMAQVGDRKNLRELYAHRPDIAHPHYEAMFLRSLVLALAQVGEKKLAVDVSEEVLVVTQAGMSEIYRPKVLSDVAQALEQIGEVALATRAALRALEAAQIISNKKASAKTEALIGVALVLARVGQGEDAAQAIEDALSTACSIGDDESKASALGDVALASAQMGEKIILERVLKAVQIIRDPQCRADVLNRVAGAQVLIGETDEAFKIASCAQDVAQDVDSERSRADILARIAQTLVEANRMQEAIWTVEKVLTLVKPVSGSFNDQAKKDALREIEKALSRDENPETVVWAEEQVLNRTMPASERRALLHQLNEAIKEPKEWDRVDALRNVVQSLGLVEDVEALQRAQATAKSIKDRPSKVLLLVDIANALIEAGDFKAATQAAEEIEDMHWRENVFIRIAQTQAQAGIMEKATQTVGKIQSPTSKASALIRVARAVLAQPEDREALGQALAATNAIPNVGGRARALSNLAPVLAQANRPDEAISIIKDAFKIASLADRDCVFVVLQTVASTLAEIDGGKTLTQVYEGVMAGEAWWGPSER